MGCVETAGGGDSKTRSVTKKREKLKMDDRCRCQPHPGLQGQI